MLSAGLPCGQLPFQFARQRAGSVLKPLAEALGVLRSVLRMPDARRQLGRIEQLQGSSQVGMVLAGAIGDLRLQVDASGIRASGRHAAVPLPLRIDDGRIRYGDRLLAWEGIRGAIGKSTVSRASGSLGVRQPFSLRAGHDWNIRRTNESIRHGYVHLSRSR